MMPEAGGMYLYIRDAFGPFPAFLYAWVAYFVILAGADAAVAVGFAEYFSVFFPALGTKHVLFTAAGLPISAGQLVAVAAVLVLSATHYVGVARGLPHPGRLHAPDRPGAPLARRSAARSPARRPRRRRRDSVRRPDHRRGLRHSPWSPSSGATTAGTRSPPSPARSPSPQRNLPRRADLRDGLVTAALRRRQRHLPEGHPRRGARADGAARGASASTATLRTGRDRRRSRSPSTAAALRLPLGRHRARARASSTRSRPGRPLSRARSRASIRASRRRRSRIVGAGGLDVAALPLRAL